MSQGPSQTLTNVSSAVDPLRACVHCGLCLEACPTYRLTGDENNSPRGRLLLWRAIDEGRLQADTYTDFYTDECVGCLACESVCPADVPYGHNLEIQRQRQVEAERAHLDWRVRAAGVAVKSPAIFNLALAPARLLRSLSLLPHPMVFKGRPALLKSTAEYAADLVAKFNPTGPKVAFLTGCLMEALFREINFATVRVLVENGVRVVVPRGQGCCGAFHEHTGMSGAAELSVTNQQVFRAADVERVVTNSAGCGFALQKALAGDPPVQDVLGFLGTLDVKRQQEREGLYKVYVDLPCHLVHGQKVDGIPDSVLDATGYRWELAPYARDCCGSGGVYNLQKPKNARHILKSKAAFLEKVPKDIVPIVATSNHVCMMQWNTAKTFIRRRFEVRHIVQLLDPASSFDST